MCVGRRPFGAASLPVGEAFRHRCGLSRGVTSGAALGRGHGRSGCLPCRGGRLPLLTERIEWWAAAAATSAAATRTKVLLQVLLRTRLWVLQVRTTTLMPKLHKRLMQLKKQLQVWLK